MKIEIEINEDNQKDSLKVLKVINQLRDIDSCNIQIKSKLSAASLIFNFGHDSDYIELKTKEAIEYDSIGYTSNNSLKKAKDVLDEIEKAFEIRQPSQICLGQSELEYLIVYTTSVVSGFFEGKKIIDIIKDHISEKNIIRVFGIPVKIVNQ